MLSRRARNLLIGGMCLLVAASLSVSPAQARTEPSLNNRASAERVPELVIDGLGKGTAPLDGPWQFHTGDNPEWASPLLDDSAAKGWEQITADKPWGAQGHDSYEGFGWYRRHIRVTPAGGVAPEFALLLAQVDDAYEIYWNGTLVGGYGKLPPRPIWYYRPPQHTFGLGRLQSGVLAIRIWKAPLSSFDSGEIGGLEAVPLLGSPADIAAHKTSDDYEWMRSRQLLFIITFLYGVVAVLGFVAWLRDRRQWILFWMALFCFSPAMTTLIGTMRLPIRYPVAIGLEQPFFALWDIALWFLLIWLLQFNEQKSLVRWVRYASILDMTASVLDAFVTLPLSNPRWQVPAQITDGVLTGVVTLVEVIPVVLVIRALAQRKRLDSTRWLVAIFACLAEGIEAVRTAAQQGERFTHWTLGEWLAAPMFTFNGNTVTSATVARTLLLLTLIYAIYRSSVENRRRQAAIEQEFKNARELQQILVPETLPELPGFALTSAYRPAQEVGGDFFQIIPVEGGSTLVILGDVSGKGLKAAMAVSLIVGATRMIAEYTSNPAEVLAGLNRRLYGRLSGGFVTAIAMRLDAGGSCTLSTAGHPAPFLNQHELDIAGSLPLGLTADATYQEHCIKLQVGDHFALYTDGLLEARSHTGELYGFARLETLFATRPSAAQATEAAVSFGQDDDITVLTLTRLEIGEASRAEHSVPELAPA
jgi:hypothetical protein